MDKFERHGKWYGYCSCELCTRTSVLTLNALSRGYALCLACVDTLGLDTRPRSISHRCNGYIDIVKCCPCAHGASESECNCEVDGNAAFPTTKDEL